MLGAMEAGKVRTGRRPPPSHANMVQDMTGRTYVEAARSPSKPVTLMVTLGDIRSLLE
jgi:hypothetical protein